MQIPPLRNMNQTIEAVDLRIVAKTCDAVLSQKSMHQNPQNFGIPF